jgi:hypothetical protein
VNQTRRRLLAGAAVLLLAPRGHAQVTAGSLRLARHDSLGSSEETLSALRAADHQPEAVAQPRGCRVPRPD